MNKPLVLILAAGKGTRMKSELSKVLHPVAGKLMINHVIKNLQDLKAEIICIVGHQAEKVKNKIDADNIRFIMQKEQLGTGHAVLQARDEIEKHRGPVIIIYGDVPLLQTDTLQKLVNMQQEEKASVTVLTARLDNPSGYGRVIRDNDEQVARIIEDKDATAVEKEIKEINSGVYCFASDQLAEALNSLTADNAQGEYYLTDTLEYIKEQGSAVIPVIVEDVEEVKGVNDRRDLARAERILRQRIIEEHLLNGVTIIDPSVTYIDSEVEIGRDTVIYPFTYLEGKTEIAYGTVIGPHSRLLAAKVGRSVNVQSHCIIKESTIGNGCNIGPFTYIRPGCKIEDGVKIGDYVELKKARVGRGSKVPHLSYVGDAEIGAGTNIGAGTIFANYDGENKHKTTVGNSVFIGSNSTLVAPVRVEDGGKTGAGAVVTHDVKEGTTVVGVPARELKKDGNKEDT